MSEVDLAPPVPAVVPAISTTDQPSSAEPTGLQPPVSEPSFTDIDIKTLSPELQKGYSSLQADYTRKTQALAEKMKGADSMQQRAQLLDTLLARPDIQALVAGRTETPKADVAPAAPTLTPDDITELLIHPEKLISLIDARADERAARLIGPVAQKAEQVMTDRGIEAFKASHPDMDTYKAKMADLLEAKEAGNLESAYRLAKYDVIIRETQQATRAEMAANAAARTESSSSSSAHTARPAKKMSFDESADAALQAVGAGR